MTVYIIGKSPDRDVTANQIDADTTFENALLSESFRKYWNTQ